MSALMSLPRSSKLAASALGLTGLFWLLGPSAWSHSTYALVVRCIYALGVVILGVLWFRAEDKVASAAKAVALAVVVGFALWLSSSKAPPPWLPQVKGPDSPMGLISISLTYCLFAAVPVLLIYRVGRVYWHGLLNPILVADNKKRIAKTGYRVPISWSSNSGEEGEGKISYVTSKLLEERSKMPPFTLWYEEGVGDGQLPQNRTRWLSVTDGNPRLGEAGAAMPHYIQLKAKGFSGLSLFKITPQVAAMLNRGNLRTESVSMTHAATGKDCSFILNMGAPGTFVPPASEPVSKVHGSAEEGDGKDQRHSN